MHFPSFRPSPIPSALCAAALLTLAACGGGGSAEAPAGTAAAPGAGTVSTLTASSTGAISAFGSVFVGTTEYATGGAKVVDDDTGVAITSAAALEVGQVVDVLHLPRQPGSSTTVASELHIHPLARGFVDAVGSTTITVMGQTAALTAATAVSDHRACVAASSNPCTAVTSVAGLAATTGSGAGAVPGNYVTVDGYLFAPSASSGTATIVATLVSLRDAPTVASVAAFKVEGLVTAASGATLTIGGLAVDLTGATCRVKGAVTPCAGAFASGTVVSASAATSPSLPATTLNATGARALPSIAVDTVGTLAGLEGRVASVGTTSFVLGGVTVDASGLTTALPAVGDIVAVTGTVGSGGTTVVATVVTLLHAAASRSYGFEGDVASVVAGPTPGTFTLRLLGESITVNASTHLADHSVRTWDRIDPAANPFNIATFQTYLATSTSQHLVVQTQTGGAGTPVARSVTIVPASSVASVQGPVDATPAVVNSGVTGTPTTFAVAGLPVSADPAAVASRGAATLGTVVAGDQVVVRGTFSGGRIGVGAARTAANLVVDFGALGSGREMPASF